MAPGNPAHGQPKPPQRTVRAQRLQCVGTARWGEPAPRGDQRTHQPPVNNDRRHQDPCRRRRAPLVWLLYAHCRCSVPTCRRSNRAKTRSRSAARSTWRAEADAGFARTTRRLPAGSDPRYRRIRSRSRRFTRLRTTALPTARLTIKPTFADSPGRTVPSSAATEGTNRCPVSAGRPALRPSRTARRKSAGRFMRACRGSIRGPRHQVRGVQALSRARPLWRRAARTARPARVRIRSRKPWVFARRRLFGWNVRLLTGAPGRLRSRSICAVHMTNGRAGPPAAARAPVPPRMSDSAINGKGRPSLRSNERVAVHKSTGGRLPFTERAGSQRLRLWKVQYAGQPGATRAARAASAVT
jgi:hypothetical protein